MRFCSTSVLVLVSVGLCACGGGGGSPGSESNGDTDSFIDNGRYDGSVNVDFTQTATPASFESAEYFRSGALDQIHASSIYSVGGTGAGQLVAIIDTGIDTDHPDLINRIHPASTNVVSGIQAEVEDGGYHGTIVAGVVAAERDGVGVHGLAYDAEVLAVRADSPGSCPAACSFSQANLALATDYASAQGADVINFSLGGATSLSTTYRQAMSDAVDAGSILVIAAGNDGASNPTYPGRFAAEAGADGRAMVVGAVNSANVIASFSNRAGVAKDAYLVAPGVSIETTYPGGGNALASGTSIATPVVSAAAATLLDAAPSLTPEQVVQLLLTTATDLGDPGVDDIYGWGLLNLAEAISPQGTLAVPTANHVDGSGVAAAESGFSLGGALGGASLPAANLMMLDDYQRPYYASLGEFASSKSSRIDLARFLDRRDSRNSTFDGGLTVNAYGLDQADQQIRAGRDLGDGLTFHAFLDDFGRLGDVINGTTPDGDLLNMQSTGHSFSSFASDAGLGLQQSLNNGLELSLTASGDRGEPARMMVAGAGMPVSDDARFAIRAGRLDQDGAVLGAQGAGLFNMPGWQSTNFAEISFEANIADDQSFFLRGALGRSDGQNVSESQPLALDDFWSSSWSLGWHGRNVFTKADRLTLAASQPLRAENAAVTTNLPVGRTLNGDVIRDKQHQHLNDQGREIDLELAYRRQLAGNRSVGINLMLRHEPGHDSSADADLIGVATYRLQF